MNLAVRIPDIANTITTAKVDRRPALGRLLDVGQKLKTQAIPCAPD